MKTPYDPRHQRRRKIVKNLFSQFFLEQPIADQVEEKILENKNEIHQLIQQAAPEWPLEKINKIDLAILELAVWELKFAKDQPPKVIIDEAIELAKEFGSESSPAFINGTLGFLLNSQNETKH